MAKTLAEFLADRGISKKDSLFHYGVPGMKWGKRKARGSSGGSSRGTKTVHPKAKSLSDEDLKARIARLQLEKTYKELTTPKPTAGQKFVRSVLTDSGKKIATQYASEYGAKAVAKSIAYATARAAATAAVKR